MNAVARRFALIGLAVAAFVALAPLAQAQPLGAPSISTGPMTATGIGAAPLGPQPGQSTGTKYLGPGDFVAGATAWWGLRAYKRSYASPGTNPAIDVCDTATGLTCTTGIKILASGNLDVATAAAAAACAVSCSVTKIYDQTGNGFHLTQATIAAAPVLTFNCVGTLPCMTFTAASSQTLQNSSAPTVAAPFSASGVAGGINNNLGVVISSMGAASVYRSSAGDWDAFSDSGCCTSVASDAGNHSYRAAFTASAGTGFLAVDGVLTNGATVTSSSISTDFWLMNNQNSNFANGRSMEGGYWPVAFSVANNAALCINEQNYWSTPSC